MNLSIDYKTFCELYYRDAMQVADITIANHIKKYGQPSRAIDLDLVKALGVSYGLEKVFIKYDIGHESHAQVTTYLSRVVHNCVLTELGKESTASGAGKRSGESAETVMDRGKGGPDSPGEFRDYIRSVHKYEKKEELIADMLACMKKLNVVDQVILHCWMVYSKGEYTAMAIGELGWEDNANTRNVIQARRNIAIKKLGEMMDDHREEYISVISPDECQAKKEIPVQSAVDYNYIRRRRRAAKKSIAGRIDYRGLAKLLSASFTA